MLRIRFLCHLPKKGMRMKICIRAHDLGVKGTDEILASIGSLGIDGVQMVCYKAYDDIGYAPGAITAEKAEAIGNAFCAAGKTIPLVGAYFNCVHSDRLKAGKGEQIFGEYLKHCNAMGCKYVGSETGSYSDDPWVYHPRNRTEEAHQAVAAAFSRLCDVAADYGSMVAMEGAAGNVCHDVDALQKVRRMMDRPTKVIFDLFNYLDEANQGDYLDILRRGLDTFADDILLFHMKDCRLQNGKEPQQVPFGTGDFDLEKVLGAIKNYDKNAVLTLEGTTGSDIAHAVQTINTIWERV